jgi:hypothetical protein
MLSVLNAIIFLIGLLVLGSGTYASVQDIINAQGEKKSFGC